jgi:hypothetical protein
MKERRVKIETYRNVILPTVLYGCKAWCFTKAEQRLRVFEDRMLRRIFWTYTGDEET